MVDDSDEGAGARFRGLDSLGSDENTVLPLLLLLAVTVAVAVAEAEASFFLRGFLGAAVVGADSLAPFVVVLVLADDDFAPPTLFARWDVCECGMAPA